MKDRFTKVLLSVFVLLLALVLFRPAITPAQAQLGPASPVGGYQLVRMNDRCVWLMDTQTGRCWYGSNGQWTETSPVTGVKAK